MAVNTIDPSPFYNYDYWNPWANLPETVAMYQPVRPTNSCIKLTSSRPVNTKDDIRPGMSLPFIQCDREAYRPSSTWPSMKWQKKISTQWQKSTRCTKSWLFQVEWSESDQRSFEPPPTQRLWLLIFSSVEEGGTNRCLSYLLPLVYIE